MKGELHWLKEVKKGGRVVILDDESIWEVAPWQAGDTCTWDLVSGISISDGDDPAFPFRLFNKGLDESVDARRRGRRLRTMACAMTITRHPAPPSSIEFTA